MEEGPGKGDQLFDVSLVGLPDHAIQLEPGVSSRAPSGASATVVAAAPDTVALSRLILAQADSNACKRSATAMALSVGDDVVAAFEVRGEHAVVSGEMGAGAWHRASSLRERHFRGGEAGDKVHRVEHDMSRPVMEGVLESIHDLPAVIDREAFVRDCWAGDVAAPPGAGNETGSGEPPELRITGQSGAVLTRNRSSRHVVMRRLTLNTPPR